MAETKPFASLSSGLLARKGGAKPAMRPQSFGNFGGNLEDLGWNDMGGHTSFHDHVPTPIDALTPSGAAPRSPAPQPEPVVLEQQREIETRFTAPEPAPEPEPEAVAAPVPEPVPAPAPRPRRARTARSGEVVELPRPRSGQQAKAKAAFTLRLDPERHLKLRLACALTRRSAQMLVTEALDEFLDSLPDLEALANRLPAEAGQRSR
jgi:hypothetical protein